MWSHNASAATVSVTAGEQQTEVSNARLAQWPCSFRVGLEGCAAAGTVRRWNRCRSWVVEALATTVWLAGS